MKPTDIHSQTITTLPHAAAVIGAGPEVAEKFIKQLNIHLADTLILKAWETNGIQDVHLFAKKLLLSPQHGEFRLGVIYGADNLTTQAQNALLKLLEEPPTRIKLILFVRYETRILPTILSRCQRFSTEEASITEKIQKQKSLLSEFLDAESIAKQSDVLPLIESRLWLEYNLWRENGRPMTNVEPLCRLFSLYQNLNSQTNKRLLLEEFVVSSL